MKYILSILVLFLSLHASENYEKHLKSQDRAEVNALNLNDAGNYKQNIDFSKLALKKYPQSEELNMYLATALYNEKQLEDSRIFFMKVLSLNPGNEEASSFINIINQQEDANQNQNIEQVLDYLHDKGIDLVMIFLGFLGGEIIAKRYMQCNVFSITSSINNFMNRRQLENSTFSLRAGFVLKSMFIHSKFSTCAFINRLIDLIIVLTFMVIILLIEFTLKIDFLTLQGIEDYKAQDIFNHVMLIALIVSILMYIVQFISKVKSLNIKKEIVEIQIAQHFEEFALNQQYIELYEAIDSLKKYSNYDKKDFNDILNHVYNNEAKEVIEKLKKDVII